MSKSSLKYVAESEHAMSAMSRCPPDDPPLLAGFVRGQTLARPSFWRSVFASKIAV